MRPRSDLGPYSIVEWSELRPRLDLGPYWIVDWSMLRPRLDLGPYWIVDWSMLRPRLALGPYWIGFTCKPTKTIVKPISGDKFGVCICNTRLV